MVGSRYLMLSENKEPLSAFYDKTAKVTGVVLV